MIRAIQEKLEVKLNIPKTDWAPGRQVVRAPNVNVGVAGSKEACQQAKQVIMSIVRYHHHEVTHPGLSHREVDVPPEYLNFIIGTKGSEIRHIKGNFNCDVHIPASDGSSGNEHVVVVGKQECPRLSPNLAHNVELIFSHFKKVEVIMENLSSLSDIFTLEWPML